MENRKKGLYTAKACRFCLSQEEPLLGLFDKKQGSKNSVPLSLKILSSISVEVFPSEKMPPYICRRCMFFMDVVYNFKNICREGDKSILDFVQTGSALEPIVWPPSLVKLFRYGVKPTADVNVLKVESGATVEVSQGVSDSEEDDENVYNVKIGDGSEEGASACVKVVTSKDTEKTRKERKKEFTSITKLTRHVRSHAGERPYPCKYCEKSFTKSHHYTRHLRCKHSDVSRGARVSVDEYRCEQCTATFHSQDELIYHSAIHATQSLTCPLCQEKFPDVDAVTSHIKSHVTGMEFMCDFCELVFTTKDKLDLHIDNVHEDEIRNTEETEQDDTSMEMDDEDEDDDIKVKEEGDHMVVEIKKPNEFMLSAMDRDSDEKLNNTNSEESEPEATMLDSPPPAPPAQLPPLTRAPAQPPPLAQPTPLEQPSPPAPAAQFAATPPGPDVARDNANNSLTATILRKAEEVKRKVQETPTPEKKEKPKTESSTGASDKSLRLLEKELQELQRTNKREDSSKTPMKALETIRGRGRPPIHTSTPKPRSEEKKSVITKSTPIEKKVPEKRAVKENKKPEESKEAKVNNVSAKENKEEKDVKTREDKDTKSKEDKETKANISKEDSKDKSVVKNGSNSNNKSSSEEPVRRSSRPSKVKDYAKMINHRKEETTHSDDDTDDDDDEEYIEVDKPEVRTKNRRDAPKPVTKPQAGKTPPAATPPTPARKRGRPRKNAPPEVPVKVKKADNEDNEDSKSEKIETGDNNESKNKLDQAADVTKESNMSQENSKLTSPEKPSNLLVAPTGQTLKKVPIRALPPGVKPLPLPATARPMGAPETCEMQIGKKMVKVQKIVMTKAEVEAMAKKGLVEMKDGTMVLKPGVKIPSDPNAIKSTLVGESEKKGLKESQSKPTPSRCDVDDL